MPYLERFATDQAPTGLLDQVRLLLDTAFQGDFSSDDWAHALGGWHAVVRHQGQVLAHGSVVARRIYVGDHLFAAGYVEAIATAPHRQGQGFGSMVMNDLDDVLRQRFELGVLSSSKYGFYQRFGWERWRGPTFVLDGDERRRTAAEDDGIMVLRFGASSPALLTAAIACEARAGDDW